MQATYRKHHVGDVEGGEGVVEAVEGVLLVVAIAHLRMCRGGVCR